jgi:hypothetical protein
VPANLRENRSIHRLQKLPRFAQQGLNSPSLGDRLAAASDHAVAVALNTHPIAAVFFEGVAMLDRVSYSNV